MQPCVGLTGHSILLPVEDDTSLYSTIMDNYDDFFRFIEKEGLHVRHHENVHNAVSRSQTLLSLPPRCFTVDFNEDFVKISALKK